MPSGGLESSGIQQEGGANPMTDSPVGVTIYNAVRPAEFHQQSIFRVIPHALAMGEANGKISHRDQFFRGQFPLRRRTTHIAAHGVDNFIREGS